MSEALYFTDKPAHLLGTLDASGANSLSWAPGKPVDIENLIFLTTIAQTVADATITVGVRDIDDGNSTTRGTFALPFSGSATDQVRRVRLAAPRTTPIEYVASQPAGAGFGVTEVMRSGEGLLKVNPGQEIFVTSNGGGDAGSYLVYAEYFAQPFSGSRVSHASETIITLS